jgi:hypothetical protein
MKSIIITFALFLLTSIGIKAGNPGWTVNPYAFQYSMTATGVLVIDHIESTDTADIIGAFVGTDCRGLTKPIFILSLGRYIAFLMIYSDMTSGETVTFKMYDSSEDSVINAVQIVPFVPNNTIGLITSPYGWSNAGLSPKANILSYSIPQQVAPAAIDTTALTIQLTVPHNTNVTALVAVFTLSQYATAKVSTTIQQSGVTANNFTTSVVYVVTAEDPAYTKSWTVTVTQQALLNTATDFLSFSFPQQSGPAVINTINHTVTIEVMTGTSLNNLVAGFTLSSGAIAKIGGILQVNNVTGNNFTNPVIYHVIAEDTSITQNWTITTSVVPPLNSGTDILTYSIPQQAEAASIDTTNHMVTVHVPSGTNLTGLIATFTLSPGAAAKVNSTNQQSGVTANNFTYPVIYEVKAEDSTLQNWIVMVNADAGVEENLYGNLFSLFPNPTNGLLNITCNTNAEMIVCDIAGKIVFRGILNSKKNTFDFNSLDNGTYLLKLKAGNKEVNSKILINK